MRRYKALFSDSYAHTDNGPARVRVSGMKLSHAQTEKVSMALVACSLALIRTL